MPKPNDLHHLAITTADIKQQIEYFSTVLGMELVALYWMHGVEGAWHAFLKLNDHASIAFVQTPEVGKIDATIGVTHSGHPGAACAAGTMQHLALNVDSDADLLALRDRIRSCGINVLGPIDHGFCKIDLLRRVRTSHAGDRNVGRGHRRSRMDRSGGGCARQNLGGRARALPKPRRARQSWRNGTAAGL
jgi:catechol 2,3-dioxygenase-like lactoylglutathione lyase family enzyme